jgi:hypothetical protein
VGRAESWDGRPEVSQGTSRRDARNGNPERMGLAK